METLQCSNYNNDRVISGLYFPSWLISALHVQNAVFSLKLLKGNEVSTQELIWISSPFCDLSSPTSVFSAFIIFCLIHYTSAPQARPNCSFFIYWVARVTHDWLSSSNTTLFYLKRDNSWTPWSIDWHQYSWHEKYLPERLVWLKWAYGDFFCFSFAAAAGLLNPRGGLTWSLSCCNTTTVFGVRTVKCHKHFKLKHFKMSQKYTRFPSICSWKEILR